MTQLAKVGTHLVANGKGRPSTSEGTLLQDRPNAAESYLRTNRKGGKRVTPDERMPQMRPLLKRPERFGGMRAL